MNRRTEIYRALSADSTQPDEWFVVHSSLPALRLAPAGLRNDFLAALTCLAQEGRTLALPTFTFSFCRTQRYTCRTLGETGIVGNWLLEAQLARRTRHPIYSFAVLGPGTDELLAAANSTTFGDDSSFGLFERHNAWLVMLGCDWSACTQWHRYEELAAAQYRHYKEFRGTADYGDGPQPVSARMFVRDRSHAVENDFSSAVAGLRSQGLIRSRKRGTGLVEWAKCRDLAKICRDLLETDPLALVHQIRKSEVGNRTPTSHLRPPTSDLFLPQFAPDPPKPCILQRPPLRIALAGQQNLELLRSALAELAPTFAAGRKVAIYAVAFGQLVQEVLRPESNLRRWGADFTFFADRLEDVFQVECLDELAGRDDVEALFDRYLEILRKFAAANSGRLFVHSFVNAQPTAWGAATDDRTPTALVARYNERLRSALADIPSAQEFDLGSAAALHGAGPLIDARLWHLGRFPFSEPFSRHLAWRWWGTMLAAMGQTARLLVVDLDGTLWGGVLGEDGVEGLQLGGEYPGNAYQRFQKCLKQLAARGIALAVCSKNDDDQARSAIRAHPSMVLDEDDFAAWRANWQPKCENIVSIAAELNLGLEHVLFIDNNPAQRELVRRQLPAVKILELPDDPARFAETLLSSPWLECLAVSDEDRGRTGGYRVRRELERQRGSFERLDDFYAWLESKLSIEPLAAANLARAEQLAQKTNQFNSTGRRYTRRELADLQAADEGYLIGLEDRFGPHGLVGLLVVAWHQPEHGSVTIENFLLSCRVLGRGIERGVLGWLAGAAGARGVHRLLGRIVPTERNQPVRSLYQLSGFQPGRSDGEWLLELNDAACNVPEWLTVVDGRAARLRHTHGHQ